MQPSNLPPETFFSAHLLKKYVLHTYYEPDIVQSKGLGEHVVPANRNQTIGGS